MVYSNPTNQSAADKSRQRSEIQRNIAMLGSDIGKEKAEENRLKMEIRKMENEQKRTELDLQAKKEQLQEVVQEVTNLEKSAKDLQKKLN